MKRFALKTWTLGLAVAALLGSPAAFAQSGPQSNPQGDDGDGPGRGVARISLMNGDVSVRRGDSGDWLAAAINAPLLVEDRVLTGPGARAEIQLDYYHRIRLAADTEIRLSQLDERQYQIQVARGTATFSALKGGDAQVEISTPGAALRPLAYGNYRVSVQPDGDALLTVRSGEADVFSPRGTERLRSGRTMQVRVVGSDSEFQMVGAIPRDSWDEFNEQRDRDLAKSKSYNYVSRDIYGAEDLDNNGEWVDVAPYGYSWRPYVADGWAPYRYGRWSWADYYGWTWVSYDPWGWAPYHYGRWFVNAGRWCWYPGARFGMRHHWSPALVGWVGWNSWNGVSLGIGVGWGAVGWVPLAPFEPFNRWWGRGYYGGYRGGDIYNRTTIINNTNITNVYRNSRVNNGVTVVNGNDFSRGYVGRPMRVDSSHLASASMARGALPVAPARESMRISDRDVSSSFAGRNANAGGERFYSRQSATRVDRVPFDQQRRALEQVANRTSGGEGRSSGFASRQAENGAAGGGWRQADQGTRGGESARTSGAGAGAGAGGSGGWQRFGDPGVANRQSSDHSTGTTARTGNAAGRQATGEESSRGGWRTFGDPARSTGTGAGGNTTDSGMRNSLGSSRSESPRADSPRWSTGSGNSGTRSESPRAESPRGDNSRWSTGSGNNGSRSETPRSSTGGGNSGARSESPRWSTGGGSGGSRSESPRSDTPRNDSQRSSPSRGRSNDFTSNSMPSGGWSTGGGGGDYSSMRNVPRSAEAPSSTSRSGPSYGGYSTGGSYGGGMSSRSSGGYSSGGSFGGGMSSRSSGSFGGGGGVSRSSGGFGGGGGSIGGGGSRSSGGFSGGGGSFGGGGGRSSGGFSGGGGGGMSRGGGGGGGGSRGGGGRGR
jgi:hypothetical protein